MVFGQELPDNAASVFQQLFALSVAAIGLAAFALVLALIEQVILEVLEENVKRGSPIYESGHVSLHLGVARCTCYGHSTRRVYCV